MISQHIIDNGIIDVFSGEMNYLSIAERTAALAAWSDLTIRPAYAYPSSEIANNLGYYAGCWYLEGSVPQKPCNGRGYMTKTEAYSAAGILCHIRVPKAVTA